MSGGLLLLENRCILENDEMYLQRGGAAKLKLVLINGDLYKMTHNVPIMNELPNVRFERDKEDQVIGLTFIYKDGREDFVKKDLWQKQYLAYDSYLMY